jgi:hypothetical protein
VGLEPDQERLLAEMVEAAQRVDRADQRWHLSERDQDDVLQGPWGIRRVLGPDIYALHHEGFLRPAGGILDPGSDWVLTAEAYAHHARLKAGKDPDPEPSHRASEHAPDAAVASTTDAQSRWWLGAIGTVKRHRAAFIVGVLASLAAAGLLALLPAGDDREGRSDSPSAQTATPESRRTTATLDVREHVRRVNAAGRHVEGDFRRKIRVSHGTVVQVETVAENPGTARARDIQIRWDLNRRGALIDIPAEIKASNLGPSPGYKTIASVQLSSASGDEIASRHRARSSSSVTNRHAETESSSTKAFRCRLIGSTSRHYPASIK